MFSYFNEACSNPLSRSSKNKSHPERTPNTSVQRIHLLLVFTLAISISSFSPSFRSRAIASLGHILSLLPRHLPLLLLAEIGVLHDVRRSMRDGVVQHTPSSTTYSSSLSKASSISESSSSPTPSASLVSDLQLPAAGIPRFS